MLERIVDKLGKDISDDGSPLRVIPVNTYNTSQFVKITDGGDNTVDVLTSTRDNINTLGDAFKVASVLYGFDGTENPLLRADAITKTLVVTDLDTYKLHQEKQYVASYLFSAVATTTVVYLRIMPHATTKCHFGYIVQSDGECKIEVIEGTTYNENGEAVEGFNRHRESTETTDQLVYHTPTINVLGTDILSVNLLGSAGKFTGSGDRVSSSDWHLKPSTDILLKVTNISTDNSEIVIKFNFWEE